MSPALEFHRYELFSRTGLNAKSNRRGHCGALIRFSGEPGVGCIHPWPELGDHPLEEQLEKLRSGKATPLIEQAVRAAKMDWLASLGGISIPRSHFTCVDTTESNPKAIFENGFRTVKLKGDGNRLGELRSETTRWAEKGFRIRIDFNESGKSAQDLVEWWNNLEVRNQIDFLEDPVLWNFNEWRILSNANIPLAADRGLEISEKAEISDWWVLKPALVDLQKMTPLAEQKGKRIVATSYMDHAIGQLWAAYGAASACLTEDCGLLTHHLFAENPFFNAIKTSGAYITEPKSFAEKSRSLLDGLKWERL